MSWYNIITARINNVYIMHGLVKLTAKVASARVVIAIIKLTPFSSLSVGVPEGNETIMGRLC